MNRHAALLSAPSGAELDALFGGVRLILCDFDGVVADSEVISLGTLRDALAAHGLPLPPEEVRDRFLGRSLAAIHGYLRDHAPGASVEGFAQSWQADLYARFAADLAPMPGVAALLDAAEARGLAVCIASSSTFERLGVALDAMGMTGRLSHVFSAELVARGKPAPDLFLHAAQRLGVDPAHCLVIEDSPHGVAAGRAAGMRCAGFTGGAHLSGIAEAHAARLREAGAQTVLSSFDPVTAHLTHAPRD